MHLLQCSLFVVLISTIYINSVNSESVKSVAILFRHGERTSLAGFPNYGNNEITKELGFQELTRVITVNPHSKKTHQLNPFIIYRMAAVKRISWEASLENTTWNCFPRPVSFVEATCEFLPALCPVASPVSVRSWPDSFHPVIQ